MQLGYALNLIGKYSTSTVPVLCPRTTEEVSTSAELAGLGLMYRFDTETSTGYIVGVLLLVGFSTGLTLQTSRSHSEYPKGADVG
jgi:hypothetical protein